MKSYKELLDDPSSNGSTIRKILLEGQEEERTHLTMALTKARNRDFIDVIEENLLSDESPVVRALSFWAISLMGDTSYGEVLLEALESEDNPDAQLSEIDSFIAFAELNNIPPESIKIQKIRQPSQSNQMLAQPVKTKDRVELPPKSDIFEEKEVEQIKEDRSLEVEQIKKDRSFEVEARIAEAKSRIKSILLEITPNIPIALKRLSDVTGVTEHSLEEFLIQITTINPSIGEYYKLEQVFMKQQQIVSKILDPKLVTSKICYDCSQETNKFPCTNCNGGLQCITCRLGIGKGDTIAICPKCQHKSHRTHLIEWVRIKASCPNCRAELKPNQIQPEN